MADDYAYTPTSCQAHSPMQLRFNANMKSLGARIKSQRELRGLTQGGLGKIVDLDQSVISKLELGDMQETTKIAQIARALKVDAYWLATGQGGKEQRSLTQEEMEWLAVHEKLGVQEKNILLKFATSLVEQPARNLGNTTFVVDRRKNPPDYHYAGPERRKQQ